MNNNSGVIRERFAPSKRGKKTTSDKLAAEAKVFLDKINIRCEDIKTPTVKIITSLDDFPVPAINTQIRIRTQVQLNMISVILKLVHAHTCIDELTIATYTLNKEAFGVLIQLLRAKQIKKLNLLVASSYSYRDPGYFAHLKKISLGLSKKLKITLVFAWIHFKITLARCGADYYQLEGSMNYSINNMAEQILFCNSEEIYGYDYDFIIKTCRESQNKALEIIC